MRRMRQTRSRVDAEDVLLGVGIGVLGGLLGAAVMDQAHKLFDAGKELVEEQLGSPQMELFGDAGPRAEEEQEEPATAKAADRVAQAVMDRPLDDQEKQFGGQLMHYGFAASMGGLYGGIAAMTPAITVGYGVPAGAALWLVADEIAVPALGLSKPPQKHPASTHVQALINHLVFGFTVELFRCLALRLLGRKA
jgi:putative membrane protein